MPIGTERQFAWQPLPETASKESCTMQAIISGVVGGGAGMVLGAILAPFNSNISSMETDNLPMKEQFRRGLREMGSQSKSWGKNLMVIGAVFSCSGHLSVRASHAHATHRLRHRTRTHAHARR